MKIIKLVFTIVIVLIVIAIPPFLKVFYNTYANWISSMFPNLNIEFTNDEYYFSTITSLLNTLIIGFLSYKLYTNDRDLHIEKQNYELNYYYDKIIKNIHIIYVANKYADGTEFIYFTYDESYRISHIIHNSRLPKNEKEDITEMIKLINKILYAKSENADSYTSFSEEFIDNYFEEGCLKKSYNDMLKKIFNINERM